MDDETNQIDMSGFYLHGSGKMGKHGPAGDIGIMLKEWQTLCAQASELLASKDN